MGQITRRDLLKLAGGATLGMIFTPVPWKLLDDTAIWTQNWETIPKIPRDPVTIRHSACTLCEAGCALSARCAGGMPFALSGVSEHGGRAALCPVGLAGHHNAAGPLTLAGPVRFASRGAEATPERLAPDEAARIVRSAIAGRGGTGRVAVLDSRPGRVASALFAEFAAGIGDGHYLTAHSGGDYTARQIGSLLGMRTHLIGCDTAQADVVLSVGLPLLDGWGTPERTARLASHARIIQAESRRSRTAAHASRWLPIRPDSERALALGIAREMLRDPAAQRRLQTMAIDAVRFAALAERYTPDVVAAETGLPAGAVRETARELLDARLPLVLAGCDPAGGPPADEAGRTIAALNLLLPRSGIVLRRALPGETTSAADRTILDMPDRSVAVLIIDGAENGHHVPWQLIERKLAPGSLVVSLSPAITTVSAHADLIVPSPAHLEALEETGQPPDSPVRSFAVAPALVPSRAGTVRAAEFLAMVAGTRVDGAEKLRDRARSIHASGRGTVFGFATGERVPAASMDADGFWSALSAGGRWEDDAGDAIPAARFGLLRGPGTGPGRPSPLRLLPTGLRGALSAGSVAPITSKLFQESGLRERTGAVKLNARTAARMGLTPGSAVRVRTARGSMAATLAGDETVPDDVALVPVGPSPDTATTTEDDVLSLCTLNDDGSWNRTSAWIEPATEK